MRISKLDMTEWADTKAAEGQLPELIRRLIVASNPSLEEIIFPYGDSVGRSGHDGFVRAKTSSPYVAEGDSVWECGRSKDPRQKANEDLRKRTAGTSESRQSELTYYCVTPRHWEEKQAWAENPGPDKEKIEHHWKRIRVLDVDDLLAWLSDCPGVEAWFSRILGKPTAGVHDAEGYWEAIARIDANVLLKPNVLLGGREELASSLQLYLSSIEQKPKPFPIACRSPDKIVLFAVASVVSLSEKGPISRTLIVDTRDSWERIHREESNLGLILGRGVVPTFPELTFAKSRNHRVVYCHSSKGQVLRALNKEKTINSLTESGIEESQIRNWMNEWHRNGSWLLGKISQISEPKPYRLVKLRKNQSDWFEDKAHDLVYQIAMWDGSQENTGLEHYHTELEEIIKKCQNPEILNWVTTTYASFLIKACMTSRSGAKIFWEEIRRGKVIGKLIRNSKKENSLWGHASHYILGRIYGELAAGQDPRSDPTESQISWAMYNRNKNIGISLDHYEKVCSTYTSRFPLLLPGVKSECDEAIWSKEYSFGDPVITFVPIPFRYRATRRADYIWALMSVNRTVQRIEIEEQLELAKKDIKRGLANAKEAKFAQLNLLGAEATIDVLVLSNGKSQKLGTKRRLNRLLSDINGKYSPDIIPSNKRREWTAAWCAVLASLEKTEKKAQKYLDLMRSNMLDYGKEYGHYSFSKVDVAYQLLREVEFGKDCLKCIMDEVEGNQFTSKGLWVPSELINDKNNQDKSSKGDQAPQT